MYKRTTFLLVLLIFFCSSFILKAQEAPEFGVIVGLNISTISGSDAPSNTVSKAGIVAGLEFQYNLNRYLSIVPEGLYSMKGAGTFGGDVTETITLSYIEFPILLKYNIPLSSRAPISANLFAGPSFAINVGSKYELDNVNSVSSMDIKDSTNVFDYGLVIGAGLDFDLKSTVFSIGTRYTFGFPTISNFNEKKIWRNGVFAITIGFGFK